MTTTAVALIAGGVVPAHPADHTANRDGRPGNLYQVSLLRAHPGQMPALIEDAKQEKEKLGGEMVIMRHSQGDHWDLMLLSPAPANPIVSRSYGDRVDYQHDFLAGSETTWQQVKELSAGAGLFHIEMFHAARGQYEALLKQRFMENDYLVATERKANAVFETAFGSDVDLFTVGFYDDMQEFAAEPALDASVFEKAAKDAGFSSRSDIGFYLRRFLVRHQDTLATQVR
jgi:hypothetical protein